MRQAQGDGVRGSGRWVAMVAVLGLVGTACGGRAPTEPDGTAARMAIIETNADWREGDIGEYVSGTDGQPLDVGNWVRTDQTGFAELEYIDGSLTRLDIETEFRVSELAGDETIPEVTVELDAGRMWSRVKTVTATEGRFDVETSVGVATIRGTGFLVDCSLPGGACLVAVSEGEVVFLGLDGEELVTIVAGEQATIDADGNVTGPEPIDPALLADPDGWVFVNEGLDAATQRFVGNRSLCNGSLKGQSIGRATTPDRAVVVQYDDVGIPATGVVVGQPTSYDIDLVYGPFAFPAADGPINDGSNRWSARVDIEPYARFGVGLYEVHASTGGAPCDALAYVMVAGGNPLSTIAGLVALALMVFGGLLALLARLRAGRSGRGHRFMGGFGGLLAGPGTAIMLQQYGFIAMTLLWLVGSAVVGLLVGIALGWPRGGGAAAAPPAPDGPADLGDYQPGEAGEGAGDGGGDGGGDG